MEDGQIPPHDIIAEGALLGAVFLEGNGKVLDDALPILSADDFYSGRHRRIYEAAAALHREGKPVDIGAVAGALKASGRIEEVGGLDYLLELGHSSFGKVNSRAVIGYARTIQAKSRVRQLITCCRRIAAEGYADYGDTQTFLQAAEKAVSEIAEDRSESAFVAMHVAAGAVYQSLKERVAAGTTISGLATGFPSIDKRIKGLRPGTVTVIGARPGVGKSALGVQIAMFAAKARVEAAVFSLEMSNEELATRSICVDTRVEQWRIQGANVRHEDWKSMIDFVNRAKGIPVHFCDDVNLTPIVMRSRTRRLARDIQRGGGKLGLVVVDYLQLMESGSRKKGDSREQEVAAISRSLKKMAKELSVPVIALSQLNRGVEQRADKRPTTADLRESGAIEQDADNIILLHRDLTPKDIPIRETECIVSKARNGAPGVCILDFDGPTTTFTDLGA